MSLANSPWPGIIKFFLASESLGSDIPAGDGKIANLFLQLYAWTKTESLFLTGFAGIDEDHCYFLKEYIMGFWQPQTLVPFTGRRILQ
jgi:hypothetical protein